MSAYYVTLPVLPWWYLPTMVAVLAVGGGMVAVVVSTLLDKHRPERYWKVAGVIVGGSTVLVGAFGLWMYLASNQPSDTVKQSVIDDAWPHLAPATVTGESVATGGGQDCELEMWKGPGAHYLMVICDGGPVSRLG
ncbi:hypothetical protein [Ornithinimicrobium murale]|uniref:hypothetical protein n=1 Tax=Ornithinimicrobium murale TaxID=1050153 RepID=UPI000E0CC0C1|nr:hypothetical protein [Ornithinimicrobium murale]